MLIHDFGDRRAGHYGSAPASAVERSTRQTWLMATHILCRRKAA
jgi:hypothetical protein